MARGGRETGSASRSLTLSEPRCLFEMARRCADGCCARFAERHRSSLNFALLVLAYVLYLLLGAWVFSAIELPYEQELRRELVAVRRDFLGNNSCVSDARLEELLARALQASNYGVSVLRNDTNRNWDFMSSLFFSSTVLTTTGEGPFSPPRGRVTSLWPFCASDAE